MPETVRLHRCPLTFVHADADNCWKVQRALDEQGIPYEVVKHPWQPRGRRKALEALSGQRLLPVVELADGTVFRTESDDMARTIRAGRLFDRSAAG